MAMTRKLRSPFRSMIKRDIRMYRLLAEATVAWARDAAAEQYRHLPYAWRILGNQGGTWEMRVLDEFEARALRRLMRRDNWPTIADQRRTEYLRRYDVKAYEALMLRREVAQMRTELTDRHDCEACRA